MTPNELRDVQAACERPPADLDWDNDELFYTHVWEDETSQFDPLGRWVGGGDYYSREYACRVPKVFQRCDELRDMFIDYMIDNHPDEAGFWVDVRTLKGDRR